MSGANDSAKIPFPGELWTEQGGVYCGIRVMGGVAYHIITPAGTEHDLTGKDFDEACAAKFGEINGFNDWHAGEQEECMLGYVNAREQFKCDSIYWALSSQHNHILSVDFKYGRVSGNYRDSQLRVRPFRNFVASSI